MPIEWINLYRQFLPTMVRIVVEKENGDFDMGAGFHIGDGFIATAKHVVHGHKTVTLTGEWYGGKQISIKNFYYPADDDTDVAVAETDFSLADYMSDRHLILDSQDAPVAYEKLDHVPLALYWDDHLGVDFIMSSVMLLGYPRIPFSKEAVVVAARGEVNAIIDKYPAERSKPSSVQFIMSTTARGGFSGGPAISEYGFCMGICTEALTSDGKYIETGFTAVNSLEPLFNLLIHNKIYPTSIGDWLKEM